MSRDRPTEDQSPLLSEDARDSYEPIEGTDNGMEQRKERKNRAQKCFKVLACIFSVGLFIAAIAVLTILLIRVGGQSPIVSVTCGQVKGTFDVFKSVFSFKAIPFAAPPVGTRRWKPPEPLNSSTCWKGTYNAEEYRNICPQRNPLNSSFEGSEDCLLLDIFTPSLDKSANLPVMVFIHGGYLRFGHSHYPGYFADKNLASKLKAVFVNVQYRVGTMGFLVLDALPKSTGNYGFHDQIQALKWVQENIENFGGNKSSVTIYGQSSGGSSVLNLMISPLAKGLFHKAWSSSGSVVFNATLDEAKKMNAFFVKRVGCDKARDVKKCLYDVSAENATMETYPEWNYPDANDIPRKGHIEHPLAVVDDIVFKAGLLESFRQKKHVNQVPLIIGTTAQEADMMPDLKHGFSLNFAQWTNETYVDYVSTYHLDEFGKEISEKALSLYPYKKDPELPLTTMITDARLTCATQKLSQAAAEALPSMLYRYVITSCPSSPVSAFGMPFKAHYAFHSWEIFAFFDAVGMYMIGTPSKSDKNFANTMQTNMMSFAQSGKMADPTWLPYNASVALIGETVKAVTEYQKRECEFWLSNGFFKYAWMN